MLAHTDTDYTFGFWAGVPSGVVACNHVADPPVSDEHDWHINVLELWPVVKGVLNWFPKFKDKIVRVFTDNTQVKSMLVTGRCSNISCMFWLRELFWLSTIFNIQLKPSYISSADNVFVDALSRVSDPRYSVICKTIVGSNGCCFFSNS